MDSDKTIQDIIQATGLKEPFIHRCLKVFKDILSPHIHRGDKNALFFDSNALVIFDQIKQLKNSGHNLPAIEKKLKNFLPVELKKQKENTYTTLDNSIKQNEFSEFVTKLEKYHNEVVEAKNEVIKVKEQLSEKEKLIEVQSQQLKLLTDGRSPEEIKLEFVRKEELIKTREQELLRSQDEVKIKDKELKNTRTELDSKVKELEKQKVELEKIKNEQLQLELKKQKEFEELQKQLKEKEDKKNSILKELEALEGKWFVGTKRKELLKQLQDLG